MDCYTVSDKAKWEVSSSSWSTVPVCTSVPISPDDHYGYSTGTRDDPSTQQDEDFDDWSWIINHIGYSI